MKTKMEISVDGLDVNVRVLRFVRGDPSKWETVYRSQSDEDDVLRIRHAFFDGYDPKSLNGLEARVVMAATIGWRKMREANR